MIESNIKSPIRRPTSSKLQNSEVSDRNGDSFDNSMRVETSEVGRKSQFESRDRRTLVTSVDANPNFKISLLNSSSGRDNKTIQEERHLDYFHKTLHALVFSMSSMHAGTIEFSAVIGVSTTPTFERFKSFL